MKNNLDVHLFSQADHSCPVSFKQKQQQHKATSWCISCTNICGAVAGKLVKQKTTNYPVGKVSRKYSSDLEIGEALKMGEDAGLALVSFSSFFIFFVSNVCIIIFF